MLQREMVDLVGVDDDGLFDGGELSRMLLVSDLLKILFTVCVFTACVFNLLHAFQGKQALGEEHAAIQVVLFSCNFQS